MNPALLPTPPRRKRFQFSLRTLMLCVLIYGGLWVLTLKSGGSALAHNRSIIFEEDFVITWNADRTEFSAKPVLGKFESSRPYAARGKATAALPFVLLWRWDELNADGAITKQFGDSETIIWLFGIFPFGAGKEHPSMEIFYLNHY